MATAAETVYRGVEGSGEAQIYGGAMNPLNALMQVKRNEAVDRARQQAAKQNRDKQMAELLQWNPKAAWEPFDQQVRDMTGKLIQWETDQLGRGVDQNNIEFRKNRRLFQDQIEALSAKSQFMKSEYENARKVYAEDKKGFFDVGYYDQKLNDVFMDDNGNGLDIATIDVNAPKQILDDPSGYNMDVIAEDFVSGLPEKLIQDYTTQANSLGLTYDIDSFKSKLFRTDGSGKIQYDPETNMPMLNLTPEVVRGAMGNTLIRNYVNDRMLKNPGETKEDILKEILMPYDATQQESNVKIGHKFDTEGNSGFSNKKKAMNRYEIVRKAVFDQDRASLANTSNNMEGVDLEYVNEDMGPWQEGKDKPNQIKITIRSKKNDPAGNPADPIVEYIPVRTQEDREAAMRKINTLIDENQGASGLRIGTDEFELADKEWKKNNQRDFNFSGKKDYGF